MSLSQQFVTRLLLEVEVQQKVLSETLLLLVLQTVAAAGLNLPAEGAKHGEMAEAIRSSLREMKVLRALAELGAARFGMRAEVLFKGRDGYDLMSLMGPTPIDRIALGLAESLLGESLEPGEPTVIDSGLSQLILGPLDGFIQ